MNDRPFVQLYRFIRLMKESDEEARAINGGKGAGLNRKKVTMLSRLGSGNFDKIRRVMMLVGWKRTNLH